MHARADVAHRWCLAEWLLFLTTTTTTIFSQVPKQLEDAVISSEDQFIQEGLLRAAEDHRKSKRGSKRRTKPTIVARFRSQLRSLGA